MEQDKTDKDYWDSTYARKEKKPYPIAKEHPVREWLEKYSPVTVENSCIEVGCYPGRFLSIFGVLGYKLNGVDFTENLAFVPEWLKEEGYKVGDFWKKDFFKEEINQTFDLVYSMGFIEHFIDIENTINRHIKLVGDEGLLIIEAPNFYGWFQNLLHRLLDKENLKVHHIPAMDVKVWAEVLQKNDFEILYAGYFGKYGFWVEHQERNFFQKTLLKVLTKTKGAFAKILPKDKRLYSPYCGIVARRKKI